VIIRNSTDRDRMQVQWDDTGEVAHILIANLERVPGNVKWSIANMKGTFLLGSAVRLHNKGTTGVVIGSSHHNDRVRVRWDDTGKVTHVKKTSLARVR
jgi:hypothetical protein